MQTKIDNSFQGFLEKREQNIFNPSLKKFKIVFESMTQFQIALNVFSFCNFKELKENKLSILKVISIVFILNLIVKNSILISLFRKEETPSIFSSFKSYNKFIFQNKTIYKLNKNIPIEEIILDTDI